MKTNIFNALKVSALAIVLSFGLSYALAWTAPTATPPTGNVSAPINTGSDLQTKAGNLSVANLGTNTITATGIVTVNDVYITSIGKYASELYPVNLVNGQHTVAQCSSLGGSSVDIGGGNKVCKLAGASCPVGWVKYNNWSTTGNTNKTYYIITNSRAGCISTANTCSSLNHAWSNTAQETATCGFSGVVSPCGISSSVTAVASITETGCY